MRQGLGLLALCGLLLLGCAWEPRHPPVTAKARADCAARGGSIQEVGMFGTPGCVITFADGGKVCADKADCQGLCLVDLDGRPGRPDVPVPNPGDPMTGLCAASDSNFGCFAIIEGGKVKHALCQD